MGLLDELKHKAEKIRAEEQAQQDAQRDLENYYQASLKPVMLEAYRYLSELVNHLQVVRPDVLAEYPLNPLQPEGTRLQQSDYRFEYDDPRQPRQLDILCQCALESPLEFDVNGREAAERHTALLDSYRFFYHRKDRRDERQTVVGARFILEGPMRVQVRILADPDNRCIHVLLRNLESEPMRRYRFNPEQLDHHRLERLGRVLLREERALVQVEVSPAVRQQLRARLDEEARLKAETLEKFRAEDRLAGRSTGRGVTDRARRIVSAGKDRLRSLRKPAG